MSRLQKFINACSDVKRLRERCDDEFSAFECTDKFPLKHSNVWRMPYYCIEADDGTDEYDRLKPKSEAHICGLYKDESYCLNNSCSCHDKNKTYVDLTIDLKKAKKIRNRAFWAIFGIRSK